MAQPIIQTSFNSGEWAPALNARVDLTKYHSGAARLRNFFVDYHGGASTRAGTKYILQAYNSANAVRLVPFQASATVGYILEFGNFYLRFFYNGAPVLEASKAITGITKANPGVFTVVGHGYSVGDWVFVESVTGMTQVNNKYFIVATVPTVDTFTVTDLFGTALNTTAYSTYTAGGTTKRVYTIPTPYAPADLFTLKFAQNVTTMVITHENYVPYVLTLISANNWTLLPITFGTTVSSPTGVGVATTLAGGTVNYSYLVTAVDPQGQESGPSSAAALANKTDLRTVAGTNRITWTAVSGAGSYNVYKAELSYTNAVPSGAAYGFIGTCTDVTFDDSNIAPDFSLTPPVPKNPFQGAGVLSVAVTVAGAYTTVPTVTFAAAPAGGATATGSVVLKVQGTPTVGVSGVGAVVGQIITFANGVSLIVATVDGSGHVLTFRPVTFPGSNPGAISSGNTPANPDAGTSFAITVNFTWGVGVVNLTNRGSGYTAAPALTFSSGAAAATATLDTASSGNPSVSVYFQQRLVLAGPPGSPQQFNMSQPGFYYNYNISDPLKPDDAIQGTLVSGQLNEIKAMIPMPSGLIVLSNKSAWQLYGSSAGTPVSATDITAQSQAYNGANDVTPIVANYDILYVQAKGWSIRNLSYNFYTNVFTGTDISVLSSHLFYNHSITQWAWAEEPYKLVWAIRDDGTMLSLTFMKEQDLIGWTRHDTNGIFHSVATVVEQPSGFASPIDAVYVVVQRVVNGHTLKYIERMNDRVFTSYIDPWCVDSGLSYSGAPVSTFSGFEHLTGMAIVGLADGIPFTATVGGSGDFHTPSACSVLIAGLAFTAQLQTLQIDTGNPTIQGKEKVIPSVTVRVENTLGLKIGSTFSTVVTMKDLQLGSVGSATNAVVADLVTGDAMTVLDARYTVPGQYCIQQDLPYPATILGVIPELSIGDTSK